MDKLAKVALPVATIVALLVLGSASLAHAGVGPPVPEIDPTMGVAALALIAGAVLIVRGRRSK
jgi:hypothetical protein